MKNKPIRYATFEKYLSYALCADALIFILFLLFAGLGIVWLKVVLAVLSILLSGAMLGYLYLSQELKRRRSLWLTTGALAIVVCILFSLILNFPSPNKYKPIGEKDSAYSVIYNTK